jgi:hypothetical protein
MNASYINTRQNKQKESPPLSPPPHSPLFFSYVAKKYKKCSGNKEKKKRTFSTPKETSKARVLPKKTKRGRVPKIQRKKTHQMHTPLSSKKKKKRIFLGPETPPPPKKKKKNTSPPHLYIRNSFLFPPLYVGAKKREQKCRKICSNYD